MNINFISNADSTNRSAILLLPSDYDDSPLPLVIVPHGGGYSAEDTAAYWRRIPDRCNVLTVFPTGHGRRLDLFSLGWKDQISDLAQLPDVVRQLGYTVDDERVYAVGISMGGLEGLMLAARYPGLLSGVVAFNAVVDVATWFEDGSRAADTAFEEVGGAPSEVPDEYAVRSPINYAATVSQTPVLMYYDPNDDIVKYQAEHQTGRFCSMVREANPSADIDCRTHEGGHFWVRPELAMAWLLGRSERTLG